jgi:threonyl-tRNA synthetase
MPQTVSLNELRRTASRILAAAALELFPATLLVQGGETSLGFYYDFIFPFQFKKEFFTLLEEKMRMIIKEKRPIQILEMVPRNAADFLAFHKQEMRAEEAFECEDTTIEIFKMGEFIDLCLGGSSADCETIGAFKLQELRSDREVTRIIGTAFTDRQELKNFLKKVENLPGSDHQKVGDELNLFTKLDESWFWHSKGERLRQQIIDFWKEEHVNQNFEIISTVPGEMEKSHLSYHKLTKASRIAEMGINLKKVNTLAGLFESCPHLTDSAHIFGGPEELLTAAISSLHFFLKISKIFDFEHELILCPSNKKKETELLSEALRKCQLTAEKGEQKENTTLEMRFEDALGRKWTVSSLRVNFKEGVLIRSAFTSLERFIALLVERYKGEFPFWLAPEQVRVFAIGDEDEETKKLSQFLQSQGIRSSWDCEKEKLNKRLHNALREKIPYCIFIGEREKITEKITLRDNHSGNEESMSKEALVLKFNAMNREKFEN